MSFRLGLVGMCRLAVASTASIIASVAPAPNASAQSTEPARFSMSFRALACWGGRPPKCAYEALQKTASLKGSCVPAAQLEMAMSIFPIRSGSRVYREHLTVRALRASVPLELTITGRHSGTLYRGIGHGTWKASRLPVRCHGQRTGRYTSTWRADTKGATLQIVLHGFPR